MKVNLEYLIVGIAKENQDDLAEFCKRTQGSAYALALSYTKDRFTAKQIVTEAYRRIIKYAYKFDTDLNAEYWLLDIVKNLSVNALCDGEFSRSASEMHLENVSTLLRQALVETDEDRGKIIVLRVGTGLSKSEIARLLWYKKASSDGEFVRGINQLVALSPEERNASYVKEQLASDINECTPDFMPLILNEKETALAKVSHKNYMIGDDEFALPGESKENRQQRIAAKRAEAKRKRIIAACITVAVVCIVAAAGLIWWFASNGETNLKEPDEDTITVTEPQHNTKVAMIENNGVLYFQNLADGGKLYSLDMTEASAKPVKLCDDSPKEILLEDGYIYYRTEDNARIYRRPVNAAAESESELLVKKGGSFDVENGKLYYSSSAGISVMEIETGDVEDVYIADNAKDFRYDVAVGEDGTVYYSTGAAEGVYAGLFRLVPAEDGYAKEQLLTVNVYDFQLKDSKIYFDMVNLDGSLTGSVCRVEITDKGYVESESMNAVLLSAAFVVTEKHVYYYGCESVDNADKPVGKGIYRVSVENATDSGLIGGIPELVISLEESEYNVSDMYVSGGYLYCYFCSGEKDGAHMELTSYSLDKDGLALTQSQKDIFSVKAR